MVTDFFVFLWAVLSHWQAYATGGLITAIVGLFERLSKWHLNKRTYGGLFIGVFLFVAFFLAWRDQHMLTKTLEHNKPDIRFDVEDVTLGGSPETQSGDTVLILYLTAKNLGGMPSVVVGYSLTVEPVSRQAIRAEVVPVPEIVLFQSRQGEWRQLKPSDAIYNKTLRPISPGAIERGIIPFLVRGVSGPEMADAVCTFSWQDGLGKQGSMKAPLVTPPVGWKPPFIPGIEGEPLPRSSPTPSGSAK